MEFSQSPLEWIAHPTTDRLDKALAAQVNGQLSRTQIKALIDSGAVLVDGRPAKITTRLRGGERVTMHLAERDPLTAVQPEALPLTVLYEDPHLAVIDKPAGMIVHPGVHNERGTLLAAMLARWPQIAMMPVVPRRAGIVHRLDKDTSGVIVVALTDFIRRALLDQFAAHTVEKRYTALLERTPAQQYGRINAPLASDPTDTRRQRVYTGGTTAITDYTIVEVFPGGQALAHINLHTGRTHQIRVHMAHIGCTLVGDRLYGAAATPLNRQFLHAARLTFTHPYSGDRLTFDSPLPELLAAFLAALR